MGNITLEGLEKVLQHKNITIIPIDEKEGELNRMRSFVVNSQFYTIEWWKNVCYLYSGGLMIVFCNAVQSGTWPNTFKTNLQFQNEHGTTMAVIGIERYTAKGGE